MVQPQPPQPPQQSPNPHQHLGDTRLPNTILAFNQRMQASPAFLQTSPPSSTITTMPPMQRQFSSTPILSSFQSPNQRIKRMTFQSPPHPIACEAIDTPYLWDLYDLPAQKQQQQFGHPIGAHDLLSSPHPLDEQFHSHEDDDEHMPMQPFDAEFHSAFHSYQPKQEPSMYDHGEYVGMGVGLNNHSIHEPFYLNEHGHGCPSCWEESNRCAACIEAKQQQFLDGWPVDVDPTSFSELHNQQPTVYVKQEFEQPIKLEHEPMDMEEKTGEGAAESDVLPLSAPLQLSLQFTPPAPGAGQGYEALARRQGKLARFLPDGVDPMVMDTLELPPSQYDDMPPMQAAPAASSAETTGRSLRVRKIRSRSPSPDLSDRSESPSEDEDGDDSSYATDHYDAEELDDQISPAPVRVLEGGDSSGQSSSEPPQPTDLLPVSASALLPSRPSTAAIPPAHIKDRLVKSAKKLLTAADGVNDEVQVQVIPIWYPHKGASGAHKIRLIRVYNTECKSVSVYAHAADVGGVVERKSNISRLFGKFESPSEKLLMNVVGAHNHTVGQESNILTSKGVRKFLATNKMREESAYRHWISHTLLPQLLHDPLEVGTELVEIEASTDPNAPSTIKPRKMKRLEQKRALKKQQAMAHDEKHARQMERKGEKEVHSDSDSESDEGYEATASAKRQKLFHSPAHTGKASVPFNATHAPFSIGTSSATRAHSSHAA